jgi:TolB protein
MNKNPCPPNRSFLLLFTRAIILISIIPVLAGLALGAPSNAQPVAGATQPIQAGIQAQNGQAYIPVGKAKTRKSIIAFPALRVTATGQDEARTISNTVTSDLTFMDLFTFLSPAAFLEPSTAGLAPGSFQISNWSKVGAEILVKGSVDIEKGALKLESWVYEAASGKVLLTKRYVASPNDARKVGHSLANDIIEAITGKAGIFDSRIAMSCAKRGGIKEIYVMDFDGTNVRQVTNHRSTAISPAWSPNGTRLAYSVYSKRADNVKNIDLFELDFSANAIRKISNRKGINSGAAYHPRTGAIALTMSFLGNPEIFAFDPIKNTVERLTSSFGFDVDPTWSPDGKKLAFVSNRSGMPMVYSMDTSGSKVERLTYAGRYNATPSWSPKGDKITFAGWIDGRFDIFVMNSDGTHIERLTKNQGNNEDPFFSPDGNFIVFSSNRAGQKNVYVMNTDGSFVKRLTYELGECVSPKWSSVAKN